MPMREVTNAGALFRQTEKRSEKAPDYTGKLNVDGTEYRLAGWLRDGRNGKFLSLKVSLAEERIAKSGRREDPPQDESEIPF